MLFITPYCSVVRHYKCLGPKAQAQYLESRFLKMKIDGFGTIQVLYVRRSAGAPVEITFNRSRGSLCQQFACNVCNIAYNRVCVIVRCSVKRDCRNAASFTTNNTAILCSSTLSVYLGCPLQRSDFLRI
jgi:hypothetical protein